MAAFEGKMIVYGRRGRGRRTAGKSWRIGWCRWEFMV